MLLEAGAEPDKSDTLRLYLPPETVDKYLALCPKQFTIKDRLGNESVMQGRGTTLYYTANATHYLRGTSRKVSELGVDEFTEFVRVADALENVGGVIYHQSSDVPRERGDSLCRRQGRMI